MFFCISAVLVSSTFVFLFFIRSSSPPRPRSPLPLHRRLLQSIPVNLSRDPPPSPPPCDSIPLVSAGQRNSSYSRCHGDSNNIFDYASLHFNLLSEKSFLSVPLLSLVLVFHFYFLVKAAGDHFSPVVSKLARHLNLSPSMGAVTLLALGNGAPDVFSSLAAVRGGHARTGLGAILSAGAFVSALVVGFVAIYAAPFSVNPAPFIRDVFFYLVAASGLFYVYLSAEIYLWQAVGFVLFYVFFVWFVFRMDSAVEEGKGAGRNRGSGGRGGGGDDEPEVEMGIKGETLKKPPESSNWDREARETLEDADTSKPGAFCGLLRKVAMAWEFPVSVLLRLTIPCTSPADWSRFYSSANFAFCPLAILLSFRSVLPPASSFPIWSVAVAAGLLLAAAAARYALQKDPPPTPAEERIAAVLLAFLMSVLWISTIAGELLGCLSALGRLLGLPPALLGLTVLAWGNSVGDLVADVAVARAGQPAMAVAGCFAGPMFNMLVGLGAALVVSSAAVYPEPYELRFHVSIVVAFVFLLLSLMGSLLVVTWWRFRVPRFWGFCLVGLYALFTAVSLAVSALFS
ncbi:unnamed protein product [Spirodela intermedia]|uniref:Sodium/calcium exchanger membrane region domain-containing protein n=1 Tax=Spirodela intermedia TaxID=51605 RepID=A0A7I8KSC3_SPIIN|nr:unnamed protein product [Spirodela intermedia]